MLVDSRNASAAGGRMGCAPQVDVEAERTALLNADEAWSETLPDVDRFMSFIADDASILPFDAPIATGAEVSHTGDLGYTIGAFELTVNDAEENPVTTVGKYVTVWKKQADGQWKVVADISNRDAPAGN